MKITNKQPNMYVFDPRKPQLIPVPTRTSMLPPVGLCSFSKPTIEEWMAMASSFTKQRRNRMDKERLSPYAMNKIWGKPCPDYNGGCPCCIAYALNGTGIIPTEAAVLKAIFTDLI